MLDDATLTEWDAQAQKREGETQHRLRMVIAEVRRLREQPLDGIMVEEWNEVQRLLKDVPGDFVTQKVEWLLANQK